MRALAGVAIVAIIAVTVLTIWLTARRRAVKRRELQALRQENTRLRGLIDDLRTEVRIQLASGNPGFAFAADLIDNFQAKEPQP